MENLAASLKGDRATARSLAMPRPKFSLKALFWLIGAVSMVLAGWATIDLAGRAAKSGELPCATLTWMAIAYVVAFFALAATRSRCTKW
jgi:hypothetical protein